MGVDALEQTAKGRLCWSWILALGITPDAKGPALVLTSGSSDVGCFK
jgi:hypothetical protein